MGEKKKLKKAYKKAKRKCISPWKGLTIFCLVAAVLCGVLTPVVGTFAKTLACFVGGGFYELENEDENAVYYEMDFASEDEMIAYGTDICRQIEAEGAVLLLNENNALPLAHGSKVSCFSTSSVSLVYASVVKFVQENINENEQLHKAKSTENSRVILALTAMGKDVTNVDGHNLLLGLTDMAYVQKQGINGPIWALIAFDSGNYPVPEGGDVSREVLIQVILDAQLADGGWALSGSTSDPDMTGMAIQALAPYYDSNANVKKSVDEAVAWLSVAQNEDGSFSSVDGANIESVAQVVVALAALGIDADEDTRFIKNGVSAFDALCAFYVEGGGFRHTADGALDGMATEQGYYALAAYFRMLDGKTGLYNMTDVINLGGDVKIEEQPTETQPVETEPAPTEPAPADEDKGGFPWWLVIVIVVLTGAIVVLLIIAKPKKGKHEK